MPEWRVGFAAVGVRPPEEKILDLQHSAESQDQDRGGVRASDAIRSRRNVRQYADRPIAGADLDEILEAARRSPSSKNTQPWDFVVVTDRDQLGRLAGVWIGGKHVAGSAATIALITSAEAAARGQVQFDLGQATMSIMIAAAGLGIGSCHSAVGDQDLARKLLGHPADTTCHLLISLGYPAGRSLTPIQTPDRRPLTDVIHRDRW
jgi:nitroreductase